MRCYSLDTYPVYLKNIGPLSRKERQVQWLISAILDVTNVAVGDRVVVTAAIACGKCRWCKDGLTSACSETNDSSAMERLYGTTFSGIFGYGHITGGYPGGQAEYIRVPFANVNCFKLPDNVPDEKGLFLSDIVVTSEHAAVEADIQKGDTVGVWGVGPIGALVCQWAKVKGASRIIAVDNVPHRLELVAQKYGAETIDYSKTDDVVGSIKKLVGPDGLDKAVDATGFRYTKTLTQTLQRAVGLATDSSNSVNEIILCVRKFGRIALITDFLGFTNNFNIGTKMEKGIHLVGCSQNPGHKYGETCLKYIQEGAFDPLDVVSHRFRFKDIAEVYERFDKKLGGIEKAFVETWYAMPYAAGPRLQEDVWADV